MFIIHASIHIYIYKGQSDKWKLRIIQKLARQNGSVVDAILQWKVLYTVRINIWSCPICFILYILE